MAFNLIKTHDENFPVSHPGKKLQFQFHQCGHYNYKTHLREQLLMGQGMFSF